MFKIIKRSMSFVFLIVLCILLILMVIFNDYTYTFSSEVKLDYVNNTCKTVYYEPYSVFKYRKLTSLSNWITKDGKFLSSVTLPGSEGYLKTDENGYSTLEVNYLLGYTAYSLSKEEYNQLKEKGMSTDESTPTEIDSFIGGYFEGNDYKKGIFKPNEILGRVKACKE